MIIVRIQGGLGNQMFQYAYAKALEFNGNKVKIDISNATISSKLDEYCIDLDVASDDEIKELFSKNKLLNLIHKIKKDVVKEKSLSFDKNLLDVNGHKYIYGYFQSEQYFLNIKNIILKQFQIKQNLSNYTQQIKKLIKNTKNTCTIHIRRGDYITNKNANKIHGTCSLEYYFNAIKLINEKINNANYFIFSDDIKWIKENINIKNATYIDDNKRIPHEDILLMSLCEHNIIANSSFSWWGSWMNQNENKIIIAPKRWFANEDKNNESIKGITCKQWIRI
jgi:hypothetical protein